MARKTDDDKTQALRRRGCLNPDPRKVKDELFQDREFFDPQDLVQVKYEMLRRVRGEGQTVSRTATDFGFSRPSFYQAQRQFQRDGLTGLIPKKRGPRGGHKLTDKVVDVLEKALDQDPSLRPEDLVQLLRQRFGIQVHPRSLERALERRKKNS